MLVSAEAGIGHAFECIFQHNADFYKMGSSFNSLLDLACQPNDIRILLRLNFIPEITLNIKYQTHLHVACETVHISALGELSLDTASNNEGSENNLTDTFSLLLNDKWQPSEPHVLILHSYFFFFPLTC